MNLTCNSGAALDDADLKDDFMIVECKVKSTMAGVSVPPKLVTKVKAQALKWTRDWAIVTENSEKERFVTIPLDTFAEIYEKFRDYDSYGKRENEAGYRQGFDSGSYRD